MPQRYDLEKIKALLTEAFTNEDLRCFCYDTPEFEPVYNLLDRNTTKSQVVDKLIKHAARKSLFDTLLKLAQERHPTVYLKHRPYCDDPVHIVASNNFPNKAQKDTRKIMSSFAKKAVRPIVMIIGLIGSLITIGLFVKGCFEPKDFVVTVVDHSTGKPIPRVEVHLEVDSGTDIIRERTDGSGIARFNNFFRGVAAAVTVTIIHDQYEEFDETLTINEDNLRFEARLSPRNALSPQATDTPSPTANTSDPSLDTATPASTAVVISEPLTLTSTLTPTSTPTPTEVTHTPSPTFTPTPTSTPLLPRPTLTSTFTITSTPIPTPTLTQNLTLHFTNNMGEFNVVVGSIETGDRIIDHLLQFGSLMGREVPIDWVPVKIDYGTYFLIPWKAIKTIYKEEEHIVVLTNGQEIRGELDGRLFTDEEKIYGLNDILELELIHVPEYQYNVEPGGQELVTPWQLQVREPRGLEFVVYNPRFAVEYCYGLVCMVNPFSGVKTGYSITETESFYLKIGDEDLEGPIYFEDLAMISSDDINDMPSQVKIGGQNDSEIIGTLWGLYAKKEVREGSDWSLMVDYLPDSQIIIVLQNDAKYTLRKIPD